MKKKTLALIATMLMGATAMAQPGGFGGGFGGFGGMQVQNDLETSQQWKDVDYVGDGQVYHTCDIYLPKQEKAAYPVVIHTYGSAWFMNSGKGMADLGTIVKRLLDAGYAVVCPNHRSSMDAKWPAQINDIKAVIRFVRGEAKTYRFDTSFIATSGFSSGAHLSAMAATTSNNKTGKSGNEEVDLEGTLGKYTAQSSAVNAACAWSAPIDLTDMKCGDQMSFGDRAPEEVLVDALLTENSDKFRVASSTHYVDPNDPPLILFHGLVDNVVPPCQSDKLYEALKAAGVKTQLVNEPEGGHGMGMYSAENLQKMVDFLDSVRLEGK